MYRKTLLAAASAIALGLAASSPAWAEDSNTDQIDESIVDNGSTASNNTDVEEGSNLGNGNTSTFTETETENENEASGDDSVAGNNNTYTENENEASGEENVAGNNNAVNEVEAEDGGVAIIGGGTVSVSKVEIVAESELEGEVSYNSFAPLGGLGGDGGESGAGGAGGALSFTTGAATGTQSNIGGIGTMQVTSGFNNLQQNSVTISAQGSFTPAANGGVGTSGTN